MAMKTKKIFYVIAFEVGRYIKSSAFIYTTIAFPIMMCVFIFVNNDSRKQTALLVQNKTEIPFSMEGMKEITPIPIDKTLTVEETFKREKKGDAMIQMSYAEDSTRINVILYQKEKLRIFVSNDIRNRVYDAYADYLHGDSVSMMMKDANDRISFEKCDYPIIVEKDDVSTKSSDKSPLTAIALMLIYFIVLQFSNNILKSISREKQNKTSEILLSSARSQDIIFGKVISGYVSAIIQMTLWVLCTTAVVSVLFNETTTLPSNMQIDQISAIPALSLKEGLEFSLLFFLCLTGGYFMYSSLFAIIGAISNANTDTQQYSFILTMPLLIAFIYAMTHTGQSDILMIIMSYLPIMSPVALIARFFSGITAAEIIVSLILLYVSMYLCLRLSAAIYRHGIIADSYKVTIKSIIGWLRK